MRTVHVIGAGLAGSEAAWQLAQRGVLVKLHEMRPRVSTKAHRTDQFAELVCSNSLGSKLETTAGGLLKKELELLDSLIIKTACEASVPAGSALAVNRDIFSQKITQRLQKHHLVEIFREECTSLPEGITIIATGPLSSPALIAALGKITGTENLYFYDAAAPIIFGDSVDHDLGFWAARYGRGSADYFNCPLSEKEYAVFWAALREAEVAPLHESEKGPGELPVFEACLPLEVLARRGPDALRYGPFRPVGLLDAQGRRPYAVLQLRRENTAATLFNLVGCQTRLKWREQKRVFRLIPALRNAQFARYGVMHRNTFFNSPRLLTPAFQLRKEPRLFLAGQMTGVEGYVESAASGLLAGLNAWRALRGEKPLFLPQETMLGSLAEYIARADPQHFQPMKANFGLLPPLNTTIRKKQERKQAYTRRALQTLEEFLKRENILRGAFAP